MTNWEKFQEVFGIPTDSKIKSMGGLCCVVDCKGIKCDECPIQHCGMTVPYFWEREYEVKKNGSN